jgi:monoamine oxidase
MAYPNTPRKETLRSSADAGHIPSWLDDPSRPAPQPEFPENSRTDLLVIGAGFTGLWTALLATEENPSRDVLILEAGEVATGASRFGARVILDILDGQRTERTALEMVRTKPLPFPPEPLRSLGIRLSR